MTKFAIKETKISHYIFKPNSNQKNQIFIKSAFKHKNIVRTTAINDSEEMNIIITTI